MTNKRALLSLLLIPTLFLAGCNSSALIFALDVAHVAAVAAPPVITAFSPQLGPVLSAALISYSNGIAGACTKSVAELGSTDPKTTQDADIAQYFFAVVAPSLPAGTSAEVSAVISAIGDAVEMIITEVHGSLPTARKTRLASDNPAAQSLIKQYQSRVRALGSDKARIIDIFSAHP
jgi:hypothetical protein